MNKMGISIETGNIKRNLKGPELRITITEMKNSLERLNCKFEWAEESANMKTDQI